MLKLGRLDQIPPGQGRCFIVDGRQLAVFRLRRGRVLALDNTCPHRGGPLSEGIAGIDYLSGTEAVVCPLHGYKFSLVDGHGLDCALRVGAYPVETRDGDLYLTLVPSP